MGEELLFPSSPSSDAGLEVFATVISMLADVSWRTSIGAIPNQVPPKINVPFPVGKTECGRIVLPATHSQKTVAIDLGSQDLDHGSSKFEKLVQWVIPFHLFILLVSFLRLIETICQQLPSQFSRFSQVLRFKRYDFIFPCWTELYMGQSGRKSDFLH